MFRTRLPSEGIIIRRRLADGGSPIWAFDRNSSVGRLDKGLEETKASGWTLASMKDDWKRVFSFEGK
jgi:hypothetical protein